MNKSQIAQVLSHMQDLHLQSKMNDMSVKRGNWQGVGNSGREEGEKKPSRVGKYDQSIHMHV
jgi:hypothetical protein